MPTDLIDIGANLTDHAFSQDVEAVLQRARDAGVAQIIVTGTTVLDSQKAADLADLTPGYCFSTVGVHPHYAKACEAKTLDDLGVLAERTGVVAIGECGLDFNRNLSPPETQIEWFEAQLGLAAELNLPVFLHQRDAHDVFLHILQRWRARLVGGVVHCFTGNPSALMDYLALDLFIGVTGWVCDERRAQDLQAAVKHIPLNRLMLETDAPYLLPRDLRPKPKTRRNEPMHLPHICQAVAHYRDEAVDLVAAQSTASARCLFNLGE